MILIVDDSPESRFAHRRALTRGGFEVAEATTGAEGLIAAAAPGVELVVLDVNLPDADGFDVCRQLKAAPVTAHVPVLQVSAAHIGAGARVTGLESGADAYLADPDPAELVASVRALLRLRAAEDRLRRQVADAETLRRLTAALADALTRSEVVSVLATTVLKALGARSTELYVVDAERGGWLERVHPERSPELPGPSVTAAAEEGTAHFDGHVAIVPLTAYGRRLGALAVTFDAGHEFDDPARELLLTLGERCGQALERAKLYEEQREIASTLQESLLPARLPEVPGVRLGLRYAAGVRDMLVGGDFYDVFSRNGDWLAVVGDVCGRGAAAAALTSLARHTIRADARHMAAPRDVLLALDGAIRRELTGDRASFLTAACARLRVRDGRLLVTLAVAGHPPPLVARSDGRLDAVMPTGPLLGILTGIEVEEVQVELGPGDALVLYTDGVTEAVTPQGRLGEPRLGALVARAAAAAQGPQAIADEILREIGAQDDDVAVLVVALEPAREGSARGAAPQVMMSTGHL